MRRRKRRRRAHAFTCFSRADHDFATRSGCWRATLGRVGATPDSTELSADVLYAGELEIRPGQGLALARGQALTLSVREFQVLVAMARHQGTIITREDLYRSVWGGELRARDRSVDVYVSKLRGKLEAALPDRQFIHTHPGFGYRFQAQPSRNVHIGAGGR